ncbi:hypothetical protein TrST_g4720 [Triparma strigata]|uniref:Ubiquitin thioesterase OTU n=1 Tax=Triparma strigata TaxID=1606541 RepID=A0A9W7AP70_9STRA|nr:hypothetical protein TrST_g4720 [Triparma strigata]
MRLIATPLLPFFTSLTLPTPSTPTGLPRSPYSSSHAFKSSEHSPSKPPWNPSPGIAEDGFLKDIVPSEPGDWEKGEHEVKGRFGTGTLSSSDPSSFGKSFKLRQVPGDGNCLFHSIALSYLHKVSGKHEPFHVDSKRLRWYSDRLRYIACEGLQGRRVSVGRYPEIDSSGFDSAESEARRRKRLRPPKYRMDHKLHLQSTTYMSCKELVESAASQYNITSDEYLSSMSEDSTWGGGPEIVSLSNALRLPIHVYELCWIDKKDSRLRGKHIGAGCWGVKRMAAFGSPKFDRNGCINVLSCDCRFPDLGAPKRGVKQGNHFICMFDFGDYSLDKPTPKESK